ncbi:MAG TPA: hypothetical protein VJ417_03960 [Candidatus Glassbacteria bacterium]|nr:hypothetical protein [Candidatus Glassbacteria bacterium]
MKPLYAGQFLDKEIRELMLLNFSGRAVESFERVGQLISREPDNYAAYLMRANCYGWFIARNPENRHYDNPLLESLEASVKHAQNVNEDSPHFGQALYFRALGQVLNARFRALRGYDITARWATRGAKDAADELTDNFPEDVDARLPVAIFDATWGGSPLWHRMVQFTLLLPRGQREKGIRTLVEISERGDDSRLWASLTLLDIYMEDSKTGQQYLEIAERLHNLFPDNSVIQLELGDSYRQMERWVLAEAVYRSINTKVESRLPGYDEVIHETSRLRMVECQINVGKMDEAYEGLRLILISNPINPEWVIPWAHFYTAKVYMHRKEPLRAERALHYALDGKDYNDLHEVVKREMDKVKKMLEDLEKEG